MLCRKILMNFAVSKGAKADKPFAFYVDYLADEGYVPPGGKEWVRSIKDVGNEANHEIPDIDPKRAALVLKFTEMLLRLNYELAADLEELANATSVTEGT